MNSNESPATNNDTHKRGSANIRILSLDPCNRGYGFVVLDTPGFLADWGVVKLSGSTVKHHRQKLRVMLERYRPNIVVIPDRKNRRGSQMLQKLTAACNETALAPATLRVVTKATIDNSFPPNVKLKYDRALSLTMILPELRALLPPRRKIWESEDMRMNIFDALCLIAALPERLLELPRTADHSAY